MAADEAAEHQLPPPGLMGSLKALFGTLLVILRTRVALLATEIEEEREQLLGIVLLGAAALFLISFGLLLLTLFFVVLFWDTHRLAVLGGFTALYLGLGVSAGVWLWVRIQNKPPFLSATLDELRKDLEELT